MSTTYHLVGIYIVFMLIFGMIKNAIKLALSVTDFRVRVGCIIVNSRGQQISSGINIKKTHPMQSKYASQVNLHEKIFLHAEISALVKVKAGAHRIFIARVHRDGSCAAAEPCIICQLAIKEAGLSEITFTTGVGNETKTIKVPGHQART